MSIALDEPIIFGDSSGDLGGYARARGQTLSLPGDIPNRTLIGDSHGLSGHAIGGNDVLSSTAFNTTIVIGDAVTIGGRARGGADHVVAVGRGTATAVGDAVTMNGHAQGGSDSVNVNTDYGPAIAYGDAQTMSDHAFGGNDVVMGSSTHGEIDLYGDAETLSGYAAGGNDRLISGSGNERMWGDAANVAASAHTGADTFVFSPLNGHDTIMDFQTGKDHIDLSNYEFASFQDVAGDIQYTPDGALIAFDANDSVLVSGVHHLAATDFILA